MYLYFSIIQAWLFVLVHLFVVIEAKDKARLYSHKQSHTQFLWGRPICSAQFWACAVFLLFFCDNGIYLLFNLILLQPFLSIVRWMMISYNLKIFKWFHCLYNCHCHCHCHCYTQNLALLCILFGANDLDMELRNSVIIIIRSFKRLSKPLVGKTILIITGCE